MKLYTRIPHKLVIYYKIELQKYSTAYAMGNYSEAWHYLERAHIIAQRYPYQHSYVHWKKLQFGFKIKNTKEILGQIPRLLFGGFKSFVGKVPVGNPGGANVPPLKPFPVAQDIQPIFHQAGVI